MAWTIRPATASDVDALYVMVEESYEKDDEFFIDYAKVCTVIRRRGSRGVGTLLPATLLAYHIGSRHICLRSR